MANFSNYVPILLSLEGGYTNNPSDPGNWTGGVVGQGNLVGTNLGISAPVYGTWIKRTPTAHDMKTITKNTAISIYKSWYWDVMKADNLTSQSVANIIVDHAVNAGVGAASKMLQTVLNESFAQNLVVDGKTGSMTIQAANKVPQEALFTAIKNKRTKFYQSIGGTFLTGWLNRLSAFAYEKKSEIITGTSIVALFIIGFLIYKIKNHA